jgi:hypothetical protein
MIEKATIQWDAMVAQLTGEGWFAMMVVKSMIEPQVVRVVSHKATDPAG